MNLTTDPWIPIVWDDGKPGTVSLTEIFSRGHQIRDLAVRPHERVALMRLLLCIAQAALDGPTDNDDWRDCRSRIVPSAVDYMNKWKPTFELFGTALRFLQVAELRKLKDGEEGNAVSKLDLALATGNNTTLFDNAGGAVRRFSIAQLGLNLLAFQCFSPGGRIGVALWNGKETAGNGSSDHAPCIAGAMLHALVRGRHLLETLHLNLLCRSQVLQVYGNDRWGRPVWEQFPDKAGNGAALRNATETYLGRLVPLARVARLDNDATSLVLANGLKYPPYPAWREPTSTVIIRNVKGQPDRAILRASLDKAPWRELHSLTVKTISRESIGGPLALQNISGNQPFDLWVGGLVADQAKLLDSLESVFHLPTAMLADPTQCTYEAGVRYAGDMEFRLRRAVSTYHRELGDNLDRAELREQRQRVQSRATFHFWTDIEHHVNDLLTVATNPALLGLDKAWHKTVWGHAVWRAVLAAYDRVCPHETSRQMRAYALGRKTLLAAPDDRNPEMETE
ncbi:MAG: type I-E CRISPR-associated protein Cse1/CasA [Planctomycetes bacterium]|nr:type I-E CRISPR-associated protein Cse1/CasA [Planctomycetota bacterium]